MTMNLIMIAVTMLVGGFVVVWLRSPRVRDWIEMPKYRILEWDNQDGSLGPKGENVDNSQSVS